MLMNTHHVTLPTANRIPIVISIPHCGTAFPEELIQEFKPELIEAPDDTDWFVDRLYNFAPGLGITMITAAYSRWVIDLNRHPENTPLYTDGRIITALCPTTTFLGDPLYRDSRNQVDATEVQRRIALYFNPYHTALTKALSDLKEEFGQVLLWDCHSIRQRVPSIQAEKFPDLILGSADGKSAHAKLVQIALERLGAEKYTLQYNQPFKGGFITRHYGQPANGQHALQLEMTKINYMDNTEIEYDTVRAEKTKELLIRTLSDLGKIVIAAKYE